MGRINTTTEPTIFALGLARDPLVQVRTAPNGTTELWFPSYKAKYNNASDSVSSILLLYSQQGFNSTCLSQNPCR